MSLPARLLGVRAAPPATTIGTGTPTAATVSSGWIVPGQAKTPDWNADAAISVGYLGYVYSFRCAHVIAETIASLPWRMGIDPDKPADYDVTHPLAQLLGPAPGGPCPDVTPRQLWRWSILQYLITGRWAWETPTPPGAANTVPTGLWPVNTRWIKPVPSSRPGVWWSGFEYRPGGVSKVQTLSTQQLFYAWSPSQNDWREAESLLQGIVAALSIAVEMDTYARSFMRNNLTGSKLIVTQPFAEPDQKRAFEDELLASMTGSGNAGRPLVLESVPDTDAFGDSAGPAKSPIQVVDLAAKMVDAQFLELKKEIRREVCDGWGVPMSMIGDASERTYANADQEHRNFWTGRVLPLAADLADHVNVRLAARFPGGSVGWFDFSQVQALRPARTFQPDTAVNLVAAGIVSAEEVRIDYGLEPLIPASGDVNAETEILPAVEDTPGSSGGGSGGGRREMDDERAAWDSAKHPRVKAGGPGGGRFAVLSYGAGYNQKTAAGKKQAQQVSAIQTVLNSLGMKDLYGKPLKVDGMLGPLTTSAIERFQRAHGLKPDGLVGNLTVASLEKADKSGAIKKAVPQPGKPAVPHATAQKAGHRYAGEYDPHAYSEPAGDDPGAAVLDVPAARGADEPVDVRYDTSPIGEGKNWVTSVGGLPLFIRAIAHALMRAGHSESQAIQMAVGVCKNWAAGGGNVTAKTRAKAAAAVAEWESKKAASHARAAVTEASMAPLMPVGMSSTKVADIMRTLARPRRKRRPPGQRHAGPGHDSVVTGHLRGHEKVRASARRLLTTSADALEPQMKQVMTNLFAKQEQATVSRVTGRRGQQMLRAAQQPPDQPVDAGQVFDLAHWIAETRQAVSPVYAAVTAAAQGRIVDELHPGSRPFQPAIDAAQQALAARGSRLADSVTRTTYDGIAKALAEGVQAGEGAQALAKRVRAVFAEASASRAEMIARTEVVGGMNTAAQAYAQNLPAGVVAEKEWLSAHDHRVRLHHRTADGQRRPVGEPFHVGEVAMMHPGDPMAPPDETINCRCTTIYVPVKAQENQPPPLAVSGAA